MPKKRSTARRSLPSRKTAAGPSRKIPQKKKQQIARKKARIDYMRRQQIQSALQKKQRVRQSTILSVPLAPNRKLQNAKKIKAAPVTYARRAISARLAGALDSRRYRPDCVVKRKIRAIRTGAILSGGSGGGHAPRGSKKDKSC